MYLPKRSSWRLLVTDFINYLDLFQGSKLRPVIYAPDRDEPNTNNSRVGYEILNLTVTNREISVPKNLFSMVHILNDGNYYNVSGELETAMDLKGYWGTYNIGIRVGIFGNF